MTSIGRYGAAVARIAVLALSVMALSACENIALMPRSTIEAPNAAKNVTATINGIDPGLRELYLRTDRNQHYVVNYTTGTQVTSRGRAASVNDLQAGDRVTVELREGTGRRLFADEIRLEGAGLASPLRTVEGTVERIVPERGFLELRTINGALFTVFVPEDSSTETRRRFERIRAGDTVRLEGERLDESRIELLAFR
jgi:translation initiation factor IF-1